MYVHKYGKPTASEENNPARIKSNVVLISELYQGRATYFSLWEVTSGDIQLSIEKGTGVYDGTIMIRYRDSQNINAKFQNELNEI